MPDVVTDDMLAEFVPRGTYAEIGIDQAYTDGNLVTAPAWPAHPAWMSQFLAVLGTKITP